MEPVGYTPQCLSGEYILFHCILPFRANPLIMKDVIRAREAQIVEHFRKFGDLDEFEDKYIDGKTKNILSLRLSKGFEEAKKALEIIAVECRDLNGELSQEDTFKILNAVYGERIN